MRLECNPQGLPPWVRVRCPITSKGVEKSATGPNLGRVPRWLFYRFQEKALMPMIDIYAAVGTFTDAYKLATDAAALIKAVEGVPDIAMFRKNTAAFVHEMPRGSMANVDGDENYVRVQVLTNTGALDRNKQLALVAQLTELVATAANDPELKKRTWVLLTEATPGGWGLWGHAHTNEELVTAARAEIARLRG